ncbi:MAG: hypothetical protein DLM50_01370 [Candidatus Meridianibacter frigidus]|nr:MAG: hypothetical protein DLM50_01370 [Candidatus Eremiobacteraeota bacterium]
MGRSREDSQRMRKAYAASLLFHALIFVAIVRLPHRGEPAPSNPLVFVHVNALRAERRPSARAVARITPASVVVKHVALRPTPQKPPVKPSRRKHSRPTHEAKRGQASPAPPNLPVVAEVPEVAATPQLTAQPAANPRPLPVRAAAPTQVPVATAAPAASAAPAGQHANATSQITGNRGGIAIFGSTYQEPVLDPHAREELQKRFRLNVTLHVLVGDDGKTKAVSFDPPQAPETEKQIRDYLASANWDAAVCGGGITCEGETKITLRP